MSNVPLHEVISALRGPIGALGNAKRKELADLIEKHGIAPQDCVTQADEETHRRVDEAVRNGRIEDRRARGDK